MLRLETGGKLLQTLGPAGRQDKLRSLGGESPGARPPDPRARAGYEYDLVLQRIHVTLLKKQDIKIGDTIPISDFPISPLDKSSF
jgi:hypothetical protein